MASTALASRGLNQWLELRKVRGTEAASEALANSEDAEELARV